MGFPHALCLDFRVWGEGSLADVHADGTHRLTSQTLEWFHKFDQACLADMDIDVSRLHRQLHLHQDGQR